MNQNMNKSAMMNGLVIGALLSLKFLFSTTGNTVLSIFSFVLSILVVVGLYYFGVRYRDNMNQGSISYGKSFIYMFRMYIYGSVVSSLVILIYTGLIEPNYLESMSNEMFKLYDSLNLPIDESVSEAINELYKPAPFALLNVLASAFGGAFWALILSAFVKKEKSIFE